MPSGIIQTMGNKRILIIEDDEDISDLLAFYFTKEAFEVKVDADGLEIRNHLETFKPDLIVLDLMLPKVNGRHICEMVKRDKAHAKTRVMIISASGSEESVVDCFRRGADEFVRKPFSTKEVVMRAKTLLKRQPAASPRETAPNPSLAIGPLCVDRQKRVATIEGRKMRLTHSEYLLLERMSKAPGRIFSREQFARQLSAEYESEGEKPSFRNIDVHILAIRKQLGKWRSMIGTARGVGYFLKIENA
ncbi:MAG: response regulator transcription factor [Opitutales bacterium]